jgi:hypothetical protein
MEIPFTSLRFGAGDVQTWGFNFERRIRRNNEISFWAPLSQERGLTQVSQAGSVEGIRVPRQRNLQLTPYVLTKTRRGGSLAESISDDEAGFDLKYSITPSLTLDVTYNTDFAQVEVDDQQINLTRFNLFFPEKRPFFLENAGTFGIGTGDSQTRAIELFFSRRIGIGPSGELVPIQVGGRLTGKAGPYNVGVMNMQTDALEGVTPAENFTVAAIGREFPNRSSMKGLFINRSATGDLAGANDWNRTWGFEGQLGVGPAWTFRGFAARTETPGATDRERSLDIYSEYRTLKTRFWVDYTEVGGDFNPEVGFLLREDYRSFQANYLRYVRTPSISWLRELRPHVTYKSYWDFEGFKESEQIHLDSHVDFENGAFFSPAVNLMLEGLKVPFEIAEGIVIPPGTYRTTEINWLWNTDQSAWLSYDGGLEAGGFYSGNRKSLLTTVNLRSGAKLKTSITWSFNDVDLAEGAFVTNLAQWRVSYSFTPSVNVQSLIQYNDQRDVWSTNLRFSWLNTAGTGLFLVYNDTEGLGNLLVGPQNRSFIVKYTHQFDVLH